MRIPRAALHPAARIAMYRHTYPSLKSRSSPALRLPSASTAAWSDADTKEYVDLAIQLRREGRKVAGVRLEVTWAFWEHLGIGKEAGLRITRYQLSSSSPCEFLTPILGWRSDRLGRAIFLSDDAKSTFSWDVLPPDGTPAAHSDKNRVTGRQFRCKPCIGIRLAVNLLSIIPSLDAHHVQSYPKNDRSIAVCQFIPLVTREAFNDPN
ncbi:hypothetical protein BV22DRAFT_1051535 [Leucogyrophana mollusca]|uniref:Uncharacterized protein n=1 Tax=Leucogyrophana mollusca TaxID=85980 RepID=A0ACB8B022_9AGAM|nr:hypothetical protein BV22DRAFT_1051535 [Leucogyrophana mollusca]